MWEVLAPRNDVNNIMLLCAPVLYDCKELKLYSGSGNVILPPPNQTKSNHAVVDAVTASFDQQFFPLQLCSSAVPTGAYPSPATKDSETLGVMISTLHDKQRELPALPLYCGTVLLLYCSTRVYHRITLRPCRMMTPCTDHCISDTNFCTRTYSPLLPRNTRCP